MRMSDGNICFRDELIKDFAYGKVCLMTGNITPIFGVCVSLPLCAFCLCSKGIGKKRGSACVECVFSITTQTERR